MGTAWIRLKSRWHALTRAKRLDAAMDDEIRFHLEQEAQRLVRTSGLDPAEARRQAHLAFGGVEKYKEAGRDTRGLRWLDAISLDLRLGLRMLLKYRGLTLVGGFAMAVAIAIGATAFEAFSQILDARLPFEEGDRIVALRYATPTPGSAERRIQHDVAEWREQLTTIVELGTFRTIQQNLVLGSSASEPVKVAEVTASAFSITRVPPLLGRHLLPGDEQIPAAPVLVIGYDAWRSRFAADPQIIGRTVMLGGTAFSIVGVMPQGFRFPIDHQYWIAARADAVGVQPLQGEPVSVFGRLASGATMAAAQAELSTIGRRAAADHPATHARLRPVVLPYTHEHLDITEPFRVLLLRVAQLFVGLLTFVIAVNLAILVYARTVTRVGEIAVRTALGASRRRILLQLFIESLALASVGVIAGLVLAHAALTRLESMARINGEVPFWIQFGLSPITIAYALAVAVAAAAIMGVLPGIKATSGRVNANLRELDTRSGVRLGGVWTTLIVTQVAVAVAILPMAVLVTGRVIRMGSAETDIAADRIGVALVSSGEDPKADRERLAQKRRELIEQVQADPGVTAVTTSSGVPGFAPGRLLRFEPPPGGDSRLRFPATDLGVDSLDVSPNLFDVYGAPLLAGRAFASADLGETSVVIVNMAFVRGFLSESTSPAGALGVTFRYISPYERRNARAGASYQILGVVDDFPRFPREPGSDGDPTIYHPVRADAMDLLMVSARFASGVPADFATRFRSLTATVDPALQVRRAVPLADYYYQLRSFWRYLAWGVALLTISVLLLSAAGMYALMSFTVAQRTREIAIRSALGAAPGRLLLAIFGRAARQIAIGVGLGTVLAAGIFQSADIPGAQGTGVVLLVVAVVFGIGAAAAAGPARRGLRIEPSDALRADG